MPSSKVTNKQSTPVKDFIEGMRYLREYLPALALVGIELGWGFGIGVVVLLSVLGTQVFHAGDAGIGVLYAGRGLGVLIGPFVIPAVAGNDIKKLRHAVWLSFMLAAIGYMIVAFAAWNDTLWLAFFALMIAHFGGGVAWAVGSILLQITTPDRLRGGYCRQWRAWDTRAGDLNTALRVGAASGQFADNPRGCWRSDLCRLRHILGTDYGRRPIPYLGSHNGQFRTARHAHAVG